ncbi:MAG: HD domain-containing protein [Candidatus Helarchaeota archaeon]
MKIEEQAKKILQENFKELLDLPASLDGKKHHGESVYDHLKTTVKLIKECCNEFNISKEDTDMLSACGWLHDIGNFAITVKGKIDITGWKYYEHSNTSRNIYLWWHHGVLSTYVIDNFEINRKEEIKKIVASHMSHWCKDDPQPENLFQYIVCISDYFASIGKKIFDDEK